MSSRSTCFRALSKAQVLLVSFFLSSAALANDDLRSRFLKEVGGESDISLAALAVRSDPLSRFGHPKPEVAVGVLHENNDRSGFVSYGLVWQLPGYTRFGVFLGEFSFAPTLLTGAEFDNKDLGGLFHFTSGLALRWKPAQGSSLSLGLRLQHISNGGLGSTNPGMDSFGLELTWVPQH